MTPENWLTVQVARTEMKKWREERGVDKGRKAMSEFVAHKRKTQIIRELNQFLSERSHTSADKEFKDNSMDYYYADEIINTMLDAEKRLRRLLSC